MLLTRGMWHLSLVHRKYRTQGVRALLIRVSVPDLPRRPLGSFFYMFSVLVVVVVVEGPDEVVEVEEKLLVVALAAVVVLLVGRRPSEYPMRQHIVQHPARAGEAESQRTAYHRRT